MHGFLCCSAVGWCRRPREWPTTFGFGPFFHRVPWKHGSPSKWTNIEPVWLPADVRHATHVAATKSSIGSCQREPRQRLWLPPLRWLLFGSCKSYGCHCYFLRKTTPQLWRQNPSPKVWRCHRCRVASHSQKEKTTAAPHMQWQAMAANQTASYSVPQRKNTHLSFW